MLSYVVRRFIVFLGTLLAASLVVFIVLEVLPGDPALLMLGLEARDETLNALREQMGLNHPAPLRYMLWLGELLRGQLGTSYTYGVPVSELISQRIEITGPLALMAFLLSTVLAIPLGMFAATRRNHFGDYGVMAFSQAGMSIPNFWLGILLVLVFAVTLGWVPSGGFPGWEAGPGPAFAALALPAIALGLPEAAILARVTRSAVLETIGQDYVRTARAKGVRERRILVRHVLRNALIPMMTILGLQLAILLAGSIVIENVFFLPGLGRLVYQAVIQRDLIVVRDVVVLLVGLVVFMSFLVDIAYAVIDPRPKAETA